MTRSTIGRIIHPNPFYPGAATIVLVLGDRRQHFGVWADTSRAEFFRLARFHMNAVRKPLPEEAPRDPNRIRLIPTRRDEEDDFWS